MAILSVSNNRRASERVIYPPREAHARLRQPLTAGEQIVLDVFDRCLPVGWEIYVQPHLNGLRPDFVLLHPAVGIGVFEVKDWDLDAMRYFAGPGSSGSPELRASRDGRTFSVERSNPVAAVNRYKDDISELYCPRLDAKNGWVTITAGVIFPCADSERVKALLAPFLTLDGASAKYQPVSGWQELSAGNITAIFPESGRTSSQFMSEELAADLRGWLVEPDFASSQREPLLLDTKQRRLVETRTVSGYRRIRGPAGSGKSLILAARAAQLASEGRSVLIVSYNITLWHYLRDLVVRGLKGPGCLDNVRFTHFHHWCRDVCDAVGWRPKYDALWKSLPKIDPDLRRRDPALARQLMAAYQKQLREILEHELPALASEAMNHEGAPVYDGLFLDEGQDFRPAWWTAIRKACRPGGELMLVADATQDIYGTAAAWTDEAMATAGFSGPPAQLRVSYRLPHGLLVAARGYAAHFLPATLIDLPESVQGALDIDPCHLRWIQCDAPDAVEACVEQIRSMMFETGRNGLANADIAFLTDDAKGGSAVVGALAVMGVRAVSTLNEDGKEARRQKMAFYLGDARLKATTLHSFKGWEARLIVISISQASTPESRALVYAALTRLKRHPQGSWITIVSSAPELAEYGEWINNMENQNQLSLMSTAGLTAE